MRKEKLEFVRDKMILKDRAEKKIIIVLFASVLLGIISLLLNLQTIDELNTQAAPIGLAIRIALSYILNGAPWAILLIFAGMMTKKWWQSILLSLISAFVALSTHYGLGIAIGFFQELGDNIVWYKEAIPLGIILGLVGYFSQRHNFIGNILKMCIPASLIIEPFYMNRFATYWYHRPVVNLANKIAAWLELSIGIATLILFFFVFSKRKNAKSNL
jgi:hypothetical protein